MKSQISWSILRFAREDARADLLCDVKRNGEKKPVVNCLAASTSPKFIILNLTRPVFSLNFGSFKKNDLGENQSFHHDFEIITLEFTKILHLIASEETVKMN